MLRGRSDAMRWSDKELRVGDAFVNERMIAIVVGLEPDSADVLWFTDKSYDVEHGMHDRVRIWERYGWTLL